MSTTARYVVGIDLGTSNCAVASAALAEGAAAVVTDFPIPQVRRPGEVAALPLLPSCLYLPGPHELAAGAATLPWPPPPLRPLRCPCLWRRRSWCPLRL